MSHRKRTVIDILRDSPGFVSGQAISGNLGISRNAVHKHINSLRRRGYRILGRNHLCPRGEVDIVAERGEVLAFVEVRSRRDTGLGSPAETVGFAKRRRVIAAATDFAVRHDLLDRRAIRFDVIAVIDRGGALEIEHLPGAFDATGEAT
jgi:putative endonuclease